MSELGLQGFPELQAALLARTVKARKTVNAKKETVVKSVCAHDSSVPMTHPC